MLFYTYDVQGSFTGKVKFEERHEGNKGVSPVGRMSQAVGTASKKPWCKSMVGLLQEQHNQCTWGRVSKAESCTRSSARMSRGSHHTGLGKPL